MQGLSSWRQQETLWQIGCAQVCGIYDRGELTLVEYGSSEVLGSCRMENISSCLVSLQLLPAAEPLYNGNTGMGRNHPDQHGKRSICASLAKGRKEVRIVELPSERLVSSLLHGSKVVWLVSN